MNGRKTKTPFNEYIRSLKIVPVAVSYENDPCDIAKAKELYAKESCGGYEKTEFEDIDSIIQGILGYKGKVHVAFGDVISEDFSDPEALAKEIDKQIHSLYKLYPMNLLAAGESDESITEEVKSALNDKLAQLSEAEQPYLINMYANPVMNSKA